MPIRSKSQWSYLKINEPDVFDKFQKDSPVEYKDLPDDVKESSEDEIFIRLATTKETNSNTERFKGYNSIPEKEGYEVVFKPYDPKGKGFYYKKLSENIFGWSIGETVKNYLRNQLGKIINIFNSLGKVEVQLYNYNGTMLTDQYDIWGMKALVRESVSKKKTQVKTKVPIEKEDELGVISKKNLDLLMNDKELHSYFALPENFDRFFKDINSFWTQKEMAQTVNALNEYLTNLNYGEKTIAKSIDILSMSDEERTADKEIKSPKPEEKKEDFTKNMVAGEVAVAKKKVKEEISPEGIHDLLAVQGADGNWNYDNYMCGMYNGMELISCLVDNREPMFRTLDETEKTVSDIERYLGRIVGDLSKEEALEAREAVINGIMFDFKIPKDKALVVYDDFYNLKNIKEANSKLHYGDNVRIAQYGSPHNQKKGIFLQYDDNGIPLIDLETGELVNIEDRYLLLEDKRRTFEKIKEKNKKFDSYNLLEATFPKIAKLRSLGKLIEEENEPEGLFKLCEETLDLYEKEPTYWYAKQRAEGKTPQEIKDIWSSLSNKEKEEIEKEAKDK